MSTAKAAIQSSICVQSQGMDLLSGADEVRAELSYVRHVPHLDLALYM